MPILTTKELQALSDQLDFEKVLHCKYLSAVQECQDDGLKGKLQSMAEENSRLKTALDEEAAARQEVLGRIDSLLQLLDDQAKE